VRAQRCRQPRLSDRSETGDQHQPVPTERSQRTPKRNALAVYNSILRNSNELSPKSQTKIYSVKYACIRPPFFFGDNGGRTTTLCSRLSILLPLFILFFRCFLTSSRPVTGAPRACGKGSSQFLKEMLRYHKVQPFDSDTRV
jgi:hypothetical protein